MVSRHRAADPPGPPGRRGQVSAAPIPLSMTLDHPAIAVTGRLFDGLYEHRRRAPLLGRDPA
jgi:hypothetical protein